VLPVHSVLASMAAATQTTSRLLNTELFAWHQCSLIQDR